MRVIVLFPGALGDLCLLAPALTTLAASGANLELSIQRSLVPVASILLPGLMLGPPIDGAAMAALFTDERSSPLWEWLQSADRVHAWLARGNADGRLSARFRDHGITAHMHAVPRADGECHVGDEYASALDLADTQAPILAPLAAEPVVLPWHRVGSARLVVHPGAGAPAKRWARLGFQRVVETWVDEGGEAAVLLGPCEEDQAGLWRAEGHEPLTYLPIRAAMALIGSAVWVGNDSGMSHLAGMLGRRGVVLFGPTRPQRWMPRGGRLVPAEFFGRSQELVTQEVLAHLCAQDAAA